MLTGRATVAVKVSPSWLIFDPRVWPVVTEMCVPAGITISCGGGGGGVLRALWEVDGAGVFAGAPFDSPGAAVAPPAWSGGGAGVEAGCGALPDASLFCG